MGAVPWYLWGLAAAAAIALLAGRAAAAPPSGPAAPAPRPPGSPPVLKKGSSGPWVSYLQSLLGVQQTAAFDAATDESVRAYQKSKGLGVDGVVGGQTWGSLGVSGSPAPSAPKPAAPKPAAPSGGSGDVIAAPPPDPSSASGGGMLSDDLGASEAQILAEVAAGNVLHTFRPIQWTDKGHTVKVWVSRRPLALKGTWSAGGKSTARLIPSVTFTAHQKIADMFNAYMLTRKVSDKAYEQADLKLAPTNTNWSQDGSMAKSHRMVEQSNLIEAKVAGHGGLTANEGKDWVLTRRYWTGDSTPEGTKGSKHNGANYGYYLGPGKVIQNIGMAHGKNHRDYSQLVRLMQPTVEIDGVPHGIAEVLADPDLVGLLSDEQGTFPQARHPDL